LKKVARHLLAGANFGKRAIKMPVAIDLKRFVSSGRWGFGFRRHYPSRKARLKILPTFVFGNSVRNSTVFGTLQKGADKTQIWPLLNLVRQILKVYGYKMIPIRKSDGYTPDGIKKFKRYFQVIKKNT
jgi:hypothetical protein